MGNGSETRVGSCVLKDLGIDCPYCSLSDAEFRDPEVLHQVYTQLENQSKTDPKFKYFETSVLRDVLATARGQHERRMENEVKVRRRIIRDQDDLDMRNNSSLMRMRRHSSADSPSDRENRTRSGMMNGTRPRRTRQSQMQGQIEVEKPEKEEVSVSMRRHSMEPSRNPAMRSASPSKMAELTIDTSYYQDPPRNMQLPPPGEGLLQIAGDVTQNRVLAPRKKHEVSINVTSANDVTQREESVRATPRTRRRTRLDEIIKEFREFDESESELEFLGEEKPRRRGHYHQGHHHHQGDLQHQGHHHKGHLYTHYNQDGFHIEKSKTWSSYSGSRHDVSRPDSPTVMDITESGSYVKGFSRSPLFARKGALGTSGSSSRRNSLDVMGAMQAEAQAMTGMMRRLSDHHRSMENIRHSPDVIRAIRPRDPRDDVRNINRSFERINMTPGTFRHSARSAFRPVKVTPRADSPTPPPLPPPPEIDLHELIGAAEEDEIVKFRRSVSERIQDFEKYHRRFSLNLPRDSNLGQAGQGDQGDTRRSEQGRQERENITPRLVNVKVKPRPVIRMGTKTLTPERQKENVSPTHSRQEVKMRTSERHDDVIHYAPVSARSKPPVTNRQISVPISVIHARNENRKQDRRLSDGFLLERGKPSQNTTRLEDMIQKLRDSPDKHQRAQQKQIKDTSSSRGDLNHRHSSQGDPKRPTPERKPVSVQITHHTPKPANRTPQQKRKPRDKRGKEEQDPTGRGRDKERQGEGKGTPEHDTVLARLVTSIDGKTSCETRRVKRSDSKGRERSERGDSKQRKVVTKGQGQKEEKVKVKVAHHSPYPDNRKRKQQKHRRLVAWSQSYQFRFPWEVVPSFQVHLPHQSPTVTHASPQGALLGPAVVQNPPDVLLYQEEEREGSREREDSKEWVPVDWDDDLLYQEPPSEYTYQHVLGLAPAAEHAQYLAPGVEGAHVQRPDLLPPPLQRVGSSLLTPEPPSSGSLSSLSPPLSDLELPSPRPVRQPSRGNLQEEPPVLPRVDWSEALLRLTSPPDGAEYIRAGETPDNVLVEQESPPLYFQSQEEVLPIPRVDWTEDLFMTSSPPDVCNMTSSPPDICDITPAGDKYSQPIIDTAAHLGDLAFGDVIDPPQRVDWSEILMGDLDLVCDLDNGPTLDYEPAVVDKTSMQEFPALDDTSQEISIQPVDWTENVLYKSQTGHSGQTGQTGQTGQVPELLGVHRDTVLNVQEELGQFHVSGQGEAQRPGLQGISRGQVQGEGTGLQGEPITGLSDTTEASIQFVADLLAERRMARAGTSNTGLEDKLTRLVQEQYDNVSDDVTDHVFELFPSISSSTSWTEEEGALPEPHDSDFFNQYKLFPEENHPPFPPPRRRVNPANVMSRSVEDVLQMSDLSYFTNSDVIYDVTRDTTNDVMSHVSLEPVTIGGEWNTNALYVPTPDDCDPTVNISATPDTHQAGSSIDVSSVYRRDYSAPGHLDDAAIPNRNVLSGSSKDRYLRRRSESEVMTSPYSVRRASPVLTGITEASPRHYSTSSGDSNHHSNHSNHDVRHQSRQSDHSNHDVRHQSRQSDHSNHDVRNHSNHSNHNVGEPIIYPGTINTSITSNTSESSSKTSSSESSNNSNNSSSKTSSSTGNSTSADSQSWFSCSGSSSGGELPESSLPSSPSPPGGTEGTGDRSRGPSRTSPRGTYLRDTSRDASCSSLDSERGYPLARHTHRRAGRERAGREQAGRERAGRGWGRRRGRQRYPSREDEPRLVVAAQLQEDDMTSLGMIPDLLDTCRLSSGPALHPPPSSPSPSSSSSQCTGYDPRDSSSQDSPSPRHQSRHQPRHQPRDFPSQELRDVTHHLDLLVRNIHDFPADDRRQRSARDVTTTPDTTTGYNGNHDGYVGYVFDADMTSREALHREIIAASRKLTDETLNLITSCDYVMSDLSPSGCDSGFSSLRSNKGKNGKNSRKPVTSLFSPTHVKPDSTQINSGAKYKVKIAADGGVSQNTTGDRNLTNDNNARGYITLPDFLHTTPRGGDTTNISSGNTRNISLGNTRNISPGNTRNISLDKKDSDIEPAVSNAIRTLKKRIINQRKNGHKMKKCGLDSKNSWGAGLDGREFLRCWGEQRPQLTPQRSPPPYRRPAEYIARVIPETGEVDLPGRDSPRPGDRQGMISDRQGGKHYKYSGNRPGKSSEPGESTEADIIQTEEGRIGGSGGEDEIKASSVVIRSLNKHTPVVTSQEHAQQQQQKPCISIHSGPDSIPRSQQQPSPTHTPKQLRNNRNGSPLLQHKPQSEFCNLSADYTQQAEENLPPVVQTICRSGGNYLEKTTNDDSYAKLRHGTKEAGVCINTQEPGGWGRHQWKDLPRESLCRGGVGVYRRRKGSLAGYKVREKGRPGNLAGENSEGRPEITRGNNSGGIHHAGHLRLERTPDSNKNRRRARNIPGRERRGVPCQGREGKRGIHHTGEPCQGKESRRSVESEGSTGDEQAGARLDCKYNIISSQPRQPEHSRLQYSSKHCSRSSDDGTQQLSSSSESPLPAQQYSHRRTESDTVGADCLIAGDYSDNTGSYHRPLGRWVNNNTYRIVPRDTYIVARDTYISPDSSDSGSEFSGWSRGKTRGQRFGFKRNSRELASTYTSRVARRKDRQREGQRIIASQIVSVREHHSKEENRGIIAGYSRFYRRYTSSEGTSDSEMPVITEATVSVTNKQQQQQTTNKDGGPTRIRRLSWAELPGLQPRGSAGISQSVNVVTSGYKQRGDEAGSNQRFVTSRRFSVSSVESGCYDNNRRRSSITSIELPPGWNSAAQGSRAPSEPPRMYSSETVSPGPSNHGNVPGNHGNLHGSNHQDTHGRRYSETVGSDFSQFRSKMGSRYRSPSVGPHPGDRGRDRGRGRERVRKPDLDTPLDTEEEEDLSDYSPERVPNTRRRHSETCPPYHPGGTHSWGNHQGGNQQGEVTAPGSWVPLTGRRFSLSSPHPSGTSGSGTSGSGAQVRRLSCSGQPGEFSSEPLHVSIPNQHNQLLPWQPAPFSVTTPSGGERNTLTVGRTDTNPGLSVSSDAEIAMLGRTTAEGTEFALWTVGGAVNPAAMMQGLSAVFPQHQQLQQQPGYRGNNHPAYQQGYQNPQPPGYFPGNGHNNRGNFNSGPGNHGYVPGNYANVSGNYANGDGYYGNMPGSQGNVPGSYGSYGNGRDGIYSNYPGAPGGHFPTQGHTSSSGNYDNTRGYHGNDQYNRKHSTAGMAGEDKQDVSQKEAEQTAGDDVTETGDAGRGEAGGHDPVIAGETGYPVQSDRRNAGNVSSGPSGVEEGGSVPGQAHREAEGGGEMAGGQAHREGEGGGEMAGGQGMQQDADSTRHQGRPSEDKTVTGEEAGEGGSVPGLGEGEGGSKPSSTRGELQGEAAGTGDEARTEKINNKNRQETTGVDDEKCQRIEAEKCQDSNPPDAEGKNSKSISQAGVKHATGGRGRKGVNAGTGDKHGDGRVNGIAARRPMLRQASVEICEDADVVMETAEFSELEEAEVPGTQASVSQTRSRKGKNKVKTKVEVWESDDEIDVPIPNVKDLAKNFEKNFSVMTKIAAKKDTEFIEQAKVRATKPKQKKLRVISTTSTSSSSEGASDSGLSDDVIDTEDTASSTDKVKVKVKSKSRRKARKMVTAGSMQTDPITESEEEEEEEEAGDWILEDTQTQADKPVRLRAVLAGLSMEEIKYDRPVLSYDVTMDGENGDGK